MEEERGRILEQRETRKRAQDKKQELDEQRKRFKAADDVQRRNREEEVRRKQEERDKEMAVRKANFLARREGNGM